MVLVIKNGKACIVNHELGETIQSTYARAWFIVSQTEQNFEELNKFSRIWNGCNMHHHHQCTYNNVMDKVKKYEENLFS